MKLRSMFVALIVVVTAGVACSGGASTASRRTAADNGKPHDGGTFTVGLDAETDGWNPTGSQWSGASYYVGQSIFDPLVARGADGKIHPYLAESVTPDAAYTHWTIKLRPGIRFHDGEPLNADALVLQFQKIKQSLLVGQAFGPLDKAVKVNDLTVRVDMKEPWVAFPVALVGEGGFIAAPKQLNASPADAASKPIGTGPYKFEAWQRDGQLTATKNPDYWRKGYPHPDKIVFRVIPDPQTRGAALESGQVDLTYTIDINLILQYRGDHSVTSVEQHPDQPVFIMLNTAAAPLDDVRVRQALAYGTDEKQLIDTIARGVGEIATEPYKKTSPWYVPSGYPTKPNLAKARSLIGRYKADKRITGDVKLTLGCTPVGTNTQSVDLLKQQWKKIGVDVTPRFTEQATYINDAINGNYQANCWTQFGLPDPDLDATWWLSTNAHPIGQLSLNISRIKDPQIDAALKTGRSQADAATRKAAYGKVWRRFAELVPYVWTRRGVSAVLYNSKVHGLANSTFPDGTRFPPIKNLGGVLPPAIGAVWVTG